MIELKAIINTARPSQELRIEIIKCIYCRKMTDEHRKCKRCDILLHRANKKYITPRSVWQFTQEAYKGSEVCRDCYIEMGEALYKIDKQINSVLGIKVMSQPNPMGEALDALETFWANLTSDQEEILKNIHADQYIGLDDEMSDNFNIWCETLSWSDIQDMFND